MTRPLRVLIVEDCAADAELVVHKLRVAGFDPAWSLADNEADYVASLHPDLDVILSDYAMPGFSGLRALGLLRERGLEIPFIIVSGTIGEDTAVAAMQQGATDYLLKDRLARLGLAVDQAVQEGRLRPERKRVEEELKLFRALVDHSNDTFEVVDPETARFLDVTEKGPAELGYTRAEYLSLRVIDIDPTITESSWPHFVEKIRTTGGHSGEGRHRRKDGTSFPIEFNAKWVRFDRGYIVTVVRDITERKQAEEALRLSVARFRAMFDSAAIGIALLDLEGRPVRCNPALMRMLGYTPEELSSMRFTEFTHPEDVEADLQLYRSLVAGEREHYELEKRYLRKDGQIVWGRLTVSLIRQTEGVPPLAIAMVEDITGRRKLEEQFLRAQRMESIGTLAGGIAHDLNNVLGPIILSLELLTMKFPDPESQDLISMIASSAQRGAAMVRQVLSFARGVEGQRVELQLKHVIRDIEKIANDTFLKHIQVRTIVPHDLWPILGDPTQLHQVLLNLCVNARDAMPQGGMLTISAENVIIDAHYAGLNLEARPGPCVFLQVEDSGTGMPPEIITRIFDPFFTTKEVGKGTGLGLSTTLGIVKSHGGFIEVHSEPGKGTTVKVYFPAQTEGSADIAAEIAAELPRGNGELILVIDDEATVREITRQTLEAFGYHVVLASDGVEAVAVFATNSAEIAAVLTDIMMPEMDGLAAIRILRRLNSQVPIIAASGLTANAQVAQLDSLGVRHFLPKPYTAETLLKTLRRALAEEP